MPNLDASISFLYLRPLIFYCQSLKTEYLEVCRGVGGGVGGFLFLLLFAFGPVAKFLTKKSAFCLTNTVMGKKRIPP